MGVIQKGLEDIKDISKFKTYGKSLYEGIINCLTEKVDIHLLSDIRKQYTLKANFDAAFVKVGVKQDTLRDMITMMTTDVNKTKGTLGDVVKGFVTKT